MNRIRTILNSLTPERIKNIRIIALSIVVAGTFWFLNALNGSYSTTFRYPIKFIYDTDKYIAVKKLPEDVLINVSGVGWNLFRINLGINTKPVVFRLEKPSETKKLPGSTLLGTITDQLAEFDVNFVLTDTFSIQIDNKVKRVYALNIDSLNINLDNNYWISSPITFSPDSVKLIGPESILDLYEDVITVKVPQQGIDENYQEDIAIDVVNNNLISRDPPTVQVNFAVEEYTNKKLMIPIIGQNFPEDSSAFLSNNNAFVSFKVALNKNEQLNDALFEVIADYKKFNKEDSTVVLSLKGFPKYIRGAKLDADTVKVSFR